MVMETKLLVVSGLKFGQKFKYNIERSGKKGCFQSSGDLRSFQRGGI